MKYNQLWKKSLFLLFIVAICSCRPLSTDNTLDSVFDERNNQVTELEIIAPFSDMVINLAKFQRYLKSDGSREVVFKKEYANATVKYQVQGKTISLDAKIRGRGNGSLEFCSFPKLKLKPNKKDETIFKDDRAIKIQTHCDSIFYSNIHVNRELLLYQIASQYLKYSMKTRKFHVKYTDLGSKKRHKLFKKDSIERNSFFIENPKKIGRSLEAKDFNKWVKNYDMDYQAFLKSFDQKELIKLFIIQSFFSNGDWDVGHAHIPWSPITVHNVEVIKKEGSLYAIPYGFDLATIISSQSENEINKIIVANTRLPKDIKSSSVLVKERVYLFRQAQKQFGANFLTELKKFNLFITDFTRARPEKLDKVGEKNYQLHLKTFKKAIKIFTAELD